MARLQAKPYPMPEIDWSDIAGMMAGTDPQGAELNRLLAASDALPAGEIVGALLQFPIADGRAYYLVTKDNPLTVQHVPFGDEWTVAEAMIRGLRRSDVEDQLRRRKALDALFARKAGKQS